MYGLAQMRTARLAAVAAVTFGVATSSCESDGTSLDGGSGRLVFAPVDAQAFSGNVWVSPTEQRVLPIIALHDQKGLCGVLSSGAVPAGARSLWLVLLPNSTSTLQDLTPGTYEVAGGASALGTCLSAPACKNFAHAVNFEWRTCPATGQVTLGTQNIATSGTVTVESVTSTRIKGKLTLLFGPDGITGGFDSPRCGATPSFPSCGP